VVGRKIHRKYPCAGLVVKPGLVPNHTTLLNFLNSCYKPNYLTNYKKNKKFSSHFAVLGPLVILHMSCALINFVSPIQTEGVGNL